MKINEIVEKLGITCEGFSSLTRECYILYSVWDEIDGPILKDTQLYQ